MKTPVLDSLRLLWLITLLVPWTAWSQGGQQAETNESATVKLLAEAPSQSDEPKELGGSLKRSVSGSTFVWASITLNGAKGTHGYAIEWQIDDGTGWRPLRADRPRKPLGIRTAPSTQNSVSPQPALRRLISQELTPADKGTLRLLVLSKDGQEMGKAEVKLAD